MKDTRELLLWVLIIIPIAYFGYIFNELPEVVPTHWNASGEADQFGNKYSPLFMTGFINIILYLILKYAPNIDNKNKEQFGENYMKIRIGIQFFMLIISMIILLQTQGAEFNSTKVIFGTISLLFAFIGNFLISVKPNNVLGFRCSWTLENETVWRKVHQIGGRFWFYGGIVMAASSYFLESQHMFVILISFVVLSIVIIYGYAYSLYNRISSES